MRWKQFAVAAFMLVALAGIEGCADSEAISYAQEGIGYAKEVIGEEAWNDAVTYTKEFAQNVQEAETKEELNACIDDLTDKAQEAQKEVKETYNDYIAAHPEVKEEITNFFSELEEYIKGE